MKRLLKATLLATSLLLTANSASAQDFRATPAYQRDLTELTRVLGQIHAIRVICNGTADQTWRNYMLNLLDVEAPGASYRRSQLIETFNSTYLGFQANRPRCDSSLTEQEADLYMRGQSLTDQLSIRAAGDTP